MNTLVISSLLTLTAALPQSETNLCGTNDRGLPRVAGDTWMEDCNRCRCTENLLPGCTKRFCNIPGLSGEKPVPGGPAETRKSSNEGSDNVNFPGVGDNSKGQPVTQCTDSLGNKRSPGESWKDDCNTCGCGDNGLVMCTIALCPPSRPQCTDNKGNKRNPGDSWKDDCNTCGCSNDGHVMCTLILCPPSQAQCTDSQGNRKLPGEAWKEDCNTCRCGTNGRSLCTQRFCIDIQQENPDTKGVDYLFTVSDGNDVASLSVARICGQTEVSNCKPVDVNRGYLTNKLTEGKLVTLIKGSDVVMQAKKDPTTTSSGRKSYVFQTLDGGEGILTVNIATGGVYGSIKPATGDVDYYLEALSPQGSVLYERSKTFFNQFED